MIAIALPRYWSAGRREQALFYLTYKLRQAYTVATIDTDAPCIDSYPYDPTAEARAAEALAEFAG